MKTSIATINNGKMTVSGGVRSLQQCTDPDTDTPTKDVATQFLCICIKMKTVDKMAMFLAELVGTGMLVLFGCMGCFSGLSAAPDHFQLSISFGLVVMVIIQTFGCVSGAHLNPAVTVAAVVYKLTTPMMGIAYVFAQVIGAFMGFGILKAITPTELFRAENATGPGLCSTIPHASLSVMQAFSVEFIATSVLILICCGVWDPRNAKTTDSVALKFGFAVAMLANTAGPYTGASMNPARTLAPAIWNGDYHLHWIYWIAPLSAGLLISVVYKAVFWRDVPAEKSNHYLEEFPLTKERNAA